MHIHPRISSNALIALAAITIGVTGVFAFSFRISADTERTLARAAELVRPEPTATEPIKPTKGAAVTSTERFILPIAGAARRITMKPFGIEIHPETSPVPNDHFNGFHVGVDFETFPEEADIDVPIHAICRGPLLFKKQAAGYGGVAVQGCIMDGQEVSVIYGHLNVASVVPNSGDRLAPGDRIGNLGKGYSEETNDVRKHLHLGIRKGRTLDIRGYVPTKEEGLEFLDVLKYLPL